jgi:transglutaminase-like putative cysteine protease
MIEKRALLFISIRTAALFITLVLLNKALPLSTPILIIGVALLLGNGAGLKVALSSFSSKKLTIIFGALFFGLFLLRGVVPTFILYLPFTVAKFLFALDDIYVSSLISHFNFLLTIFFATLCSTILVVRSQWGVTLEASLSALLCITALSGHRLLNLNRPRLANELAWYFGISPQAFFVTCGALTTIFLLFYLSLGSALARSARGDKASFTSSKTSSLLATTILLLIVSSISYLLLDSVKKEQVSKVSNGVGQGAQSGDKPLGFHSALGRSAEPAALIRFDSDYQQNPFSPMLYFRESALSEIAGYEMVVAGDAHDKDVPRLAPGGTLEVKELDNEVNTVNSFRERVKYSVYLISNHRTVFGVDYPIKLALLKNPEPARFNTAYQVESLAPSFPLADLSGHEVGDPKWSSATLEHYLKTHTDKRYLERAKEILLNSNIADKAPILQAEGIKNYLSKEAIYTLDPRHAVKPEEDPVAPFLFGDMRGYCVHFAHATVFMLRALGIPARIGTGYLTDLTQARDGHVLLRMTDRHAWAEVFVRDIGWVPFDPTPTQVESHAETEVDPKTLEELMGLLTPPEVLLNKELSKEKNAQLEKLFNLPNWRIFLYFFLILLTLYFLLKCYLFFGWRLFWELGKERAYITAVLARLEDLELPRKFGESRCEYQKRLQCNGLNLEIPLLVASFDLSRPIDKEHISQGKFLNDIRAFNYLSGFSRFKLLLSYRSIQAWWNGKISGRKR